MNYINIGLIIHFNIFIVPPIPNIRNMSNVIYILIICYNINVYTIVKTNVFIIVILF